MKRLLLTLFSVISTIYANAQITAYPSVNNSKVFAASCADLHYVNPIVIGHQLNVTVTYYENLNDAQNEVNALDRFYEPLSDPQTIYARLDSQLDDSFAIAESIVDTAPVPGGPPPGISPVYFDVCDVDMNGSEIIYLDNLRALYDGYAFPTTTFCGSQDNEVVTNYYLTEADAINETNPLNPIYTLIGTQNFFRKIKNVNTNEFLIDDMITVTVISCTTDTDMDGIADLAEDANRNLLNTDDDTDQDGLKNFEDDDDDGDGILTINEDYNGNGDPTDDDSNSNNIPDYLESSVTLSLQENNQIKLTIYPNPVSDQLYIVTNQASPLSSILIQDIMGKTVLKIELHDSNGTIDVSSLSSGLYVLKVENNNEIITHKFIKN